jgi:protoheme IX farnesyltransferase
LWRDLIVLTKPGIIRLNLVASFGGFWIASRGKLDWPLLLWTLVGVTLTMASACVFNNYFDRDLDIRMERTKHRPLPAGRVSPALALRYAIVLGVAGLAVLFLLVNPLVGLLGAVGHFVYVVVYTLWLKRRSPWSTDIGGISGAMPPVIGYCAVTGKIDAGAILLFALLFFWQPTHFWSLGIRRKDEYAAAGFPMLPVVKGIRRTKWQMAVYILLLIPTCVLLYAYGYAGVYFLAVSVLLGGIWLIHILSGLRARDDAQWAKRDFLISVNYLFLVFIVMILDAGRG